jgi:hypothetical protein
LMTTFPEKSGIIDSAENFIDVKVWHHPSRTSPSSKREENNLRRI